MEPHSRRPAETPFSRPDDPNNRAHDDEEDYRRYELEGREEDAPFLPHGQGRRKQRIISLRRGAVLSWVGLKGPRRRRSLYARVSQTVALATCALVLLIVGCGLLFPSYSNPPQRYTELRERVEQRGESANLHNETIFIATSLYDHRGELLTGAWAEAVLKLIDILGPENVFLSIYENNPDSGALAAMESFRTRVECQSEIVSEDLDLHTYPRVITADGQNRLKRMAFLADVRNRALNPLQNSSSPAYHTRFDKLLYLNDIIFDPVDAANLLFSTGADAVSGKTDYNAACAVDFINPFKFYDTFAVRDYMGYDMGVPFYPWFTNAGKGESRHDVLHQKDAVRVKACWGGMVAFDAKYFQEQSSSVRAPDSSVRFRYETDTYWDASECCLIHADIIAKDRTLSGDETKIYMNPYVRVSYDTTTFSWLSFTKRFERLYTPVHSLVNWIARRPSMTPRRFTQPGEEVTNRVWLWNETASRGQFEDVRRAALPGGYCGYRLLMTINEHQAEGEKNWEFETPPYEG